MINHKKYCLARSEATNQDGLWTVMNESENLDPQTVMNESENLDPQTPTGICPRGPERIPTS